MHVLHDRQTGCSSRVYPRGVPGHFLHFLAGGLTLTLLLLPFQRAVAAPPAIAASARAQIQALQDEKAHRTQAQCKMDCHLIYAARQHQKQPLIKGFTNWPVRVHYEADGRMLVDIDSEVTPGVLAAIAKAGGTVVTQVPRFHAIRALLPVEQAEALAGRSDIRFIRPAAKARTNTGSVDSEGDVTHQANLARSTFGVDGTGVNIGVLSDSVDYLADSQASGDLGAVTVLPGESGVGLPNVEGEGTAMLEIVHDLAPGANLFFATAEGGDATFAQNILDLQAAGCNIIVDDITYFDESPFQDGVIAKAVNTVTSNGVLYFSSAANSGNLDHGTSGTWEGDFVDGGAANASLTEAGRLLNFGGGSTYNTVTGALDSSALEVDLFWSDPLGASRNDYDVYVLDSTGSSVVDQSNNPQTGTQDPYEHCALEEGDRIVIVRRSGESRFLHLDTGRGCLAIGTTGSTHGHNAAASAMTVAATDVSNSYDYFSDSYYAFSGGAYDPVEYFSSDGPRRIFYNPDGTAITPGNFSSTGGRLLQKPDMTAADDVSTSLSGFDPFRGTSAAAPHAAAIAGLAWSFDSTLTPAAILFAMTNTAIDIEAPGVDRDSGAGIVMALSTLQSLAARSPPVFLGAHMREALGNGSGSADPGETINEWIVWSNRSTVTRSSITATLSSATPGVTMLQGSASYPNMPPYTVASNAVPFSYRLAKNIPLGTVAVFTNILTYAGATVTASFTRAIGLTAYATNTYAGSFTGVAIPDYGWGTLYSNISVAAGAAVIDDVNVFLRIDHTSDGDLAMAIQHPDGTKVQLTSQNFVAYGSQNFGTGYAPGVVVNTVFDDGAATAIGSGSAPFAGSYRPIGAPTNRLANLNGKSASGTWRLQISDMAYWDTGTLYRCGVTLATHVGGGIYNTAPVASNQSASVLAGASTNLILCGSDADGDPITFRLVGIPAHGTLQGMNTNNGAVTYLASPTYAGPDSFTFVANDGYTDSVPATVSLTTVSTTTNTLTVVSALGGANPGGTFSAGTYSFVSGWITNSPVVLGAATQYVCTGGTVAGNDFTPVSATNVTLTLTNNATLTWNWQVQSYRLTVTTNGPGTVAVAPATAWCLAGSNAVLTATPLAQYRFFSWSGDTNGCTIVGNVITAAMTQARSIRATFEPAQQTLTVVSADGGATPGTVVVGYGSNTTQWVTNSPIPVGVGTQIVCTGGMVAGNAFTLISPTNITLTLTNDATLTWNWTTNDWLGTTTNGAGRVSVPSSWQNVGSTVVVWATPAANAHFVQWTGDTNGCLITSNCITAGMTQTRKITAGFAAGALPVISGKVTKAGSTNGVPGVTITFSNTVGTITVTTAAGGSYSNTVAYKWSGTATASYSSGGFATPTITYKTLTANQTGKNYIWTPSPVISGKVTKSGSTNGVAGVTITFSNAVGVITVTTDAGGSYSNTVPYKWSGKATASFTSGGFATPTITYSALIANQTGKNYVWTPSPVISGKVTKTGSTNGVPGVKITFSGVGTTNTDNSGNYSMTAPYSWNGTATPSTNGIGGIISPISKSYSKLIANSTAQNYTWTPPPVISGKVTKSGSTNGVPDVTITFSGVGTTTTGTNGAYAMTVPYNWAGSAKPSSTVGGVFSPTNRAYSKLIANSAAQNYIWAAPVGSIVRQSVLDSAILTTTNGFAQWAILHGLVGNPADLFGQIAGNDGLTYGAEYAFGVNLAKGEPLMRLLTFNRVLTAEVPLQDPATLVDARVMVEFTRHEGSSIWFPAVCLPPLAPTPLTKQWFQSGTGDAADFRVTVRLIDVP